MALIKSVATIVTQVEVDRNDPAFQNPTKPIGSFMEKEQALEKKEKEGWSVVEDAGRGWRRVVPSPLPMRVVEEPAIKALINAGVCVVTVGGGGIPVVADENGKLKGIAAVIDKDFASSLLANLVGAELFVISTAVEKAAINWGKPEQKWLDTDDRCRSQGLPGRRHPLCQRAAWLPRSRPASGLSSAAAKGL